MANRGHRVQLIAEAPAGFKGGVAEALAFYGLPTNPNLDLRLLRGGRTRRSLQYRAHLAAFVISSAGQGVLVSRSKKQAVEARRLYRKRVRIVLETHELDSALAAERGEPVEHWSRLEQSAATAADLVVANAPGTLELWAERYRIPPAIFLHNATRQDRVRRAGKEASGVAYVGSARPYKDLNSVVELARCCEYPVTWIGASEESALRDSNLQLQPSVPHVEVPDLLCRFRVLLLPLSPGVFGEKLCSPLKLWDYMAAGVPIVGADLPSLRRAAPGAFVPYTAGDPASLHEAVCRAYSDEAIRAEVLGASFVYTWDQRAEEFERFLSEAL
jgi:glycosyltransferase involved in cell wall biosynthesis